MRQTIQDTSIVRRIFVRVLNPSSATCKHHLPYSPAPDFVSRYLFLSSRKKGSPSVDINTTSELPHIILPVLFSVFRILRIILMLSRSAGQNQENRSPAGNRKQRRPQNYIGQIPGLWEMGKDDLRKPSRDAWIFFR